MAFVQGVDLLKIFQGAQAYGRMKHDMEEHKLAVEQHKFDVEQRRKKMEFEEKSRQAQAKFLQADTPEARAAALDEFRAVAPSQAMETEEKLGDFETKRQTFAAKRRDMLMEQGVESARVMQSLLPQTIGENGLPDFRQLVGAASRMHRMAQGGIIGKEQAAKVAELASSMQQLEQAGAQGLGEDQLMAGMSGIKDNIEKLIGASEQVIYEFGDPKKRARYTAELEQLGAWASEIAGGPSDYEYQKRHNPDVLAFVRAKRDKGKMDRAKAGRDIVNIGGDPHKKLTRGAETATQKNWMESQALLDTYDVTKNHVEPWMLTTPGRLAVKTGDILASIDPELIPKEYQGKYKQYWAASVGVETAFSLYRKYITGAQAAMAEIEYLRKQAPNMDMTWPQFQAALGQKMGELQRKIKMYNKAMRYGLDLVNSGEISEDELTNEWVNKKASALELQGAEPDKSDMVWRVRRLEQAGVQKKKQIDILLREGYINEKQAESMRRRL